MIVIKKIQKIDDFRIFKHFLWSDDLEEFSKYNLIYGWNGSGKTTLSNVFRQLEERKLFPDCSGLQLQINDEIITEKNINRLSLMIKVFNQDFVSENVFNPKQDVSPIFFLGKEDIRKQNEISRLTTERNQIETNDLSNTLNKITTEKDKLCTSIAKNIKDCNRTSEKDRYTNYTKKEFIAKCEFLKKQDYKNKILTENEFYELKRKKESTPKDKITEVKLNLLSQTEIKSFVEPMLNKTVVSETIERLQINNELNEWVSSGLKIYNEEKSGRCPFCEQELKKDVIESLEKYFNDQYDEFINDLESLKKDIYSYKNATTAHFPHETEFYIEYRDQYSLSLNEFESKLREYSNYLDLLLIQIEEKRKNPFQKIEMKYDISKIDLTGIGILNSIIKLNNAKTTNFIEDLAKSKTKLEEHYVAENLDNYLILEVKQNQISQQLREINTAIDILDTNIKELENQIIEHLRPAEEINEELHSYLGRDEIKFEIRENGYQIKRFGEVAKSLSEGEKTAISFIYFLKTLQDKNFDIKRGIIVIDDPISSLDSNALYNAFGFMKNRTKDALQLFILTHNHSFFKEVKNWWKAGRSQASRNRSINSSYYMLKNMVVDGQRVAKLRPLDNMLKEYNSEYHYLFSLVYKNSTDCDGNFENYYLLPNICRRLLEAFLAFRVPSEIGNFGNQINKLDITEEKKIRIQRYTDANSHSDYIRDDPEKDLSFLDETPSILTDILELIKVEDPKHFNEMKRLIDKKSN